jgi:hypothetical protein
MVMTGSNRKMGRQGAFLAEKHADFLDYNGIASKVSGNVSADIFAKT